MRYKRIRKVKEIERGSARSAGLDFFIPTMDADYLLDVATINHDELTNDQIYIDTYKKQIVLAPGAHVLLPSGIKCDFQTIDGVLYDEEHGIAYVAHNKSSIAKNKRLQVAADVVDEDYQGELHFSLVNTSNRLIKVSSDEKIAQFLTVPIIMSSPVEIEENEVLHATITARAGKGFGSTTIPKS